MCTDVLEERAVNKLNIPYFTNLIILPQNCFMPAVRSTQCLRAHFSNICYPLQQKLLRLHSLPSDYTFILEGVETESDSVQFIANETSRAVSDVHLRFYYS